MNQIELLNSWIAYKSALNARRLTKSIEVEFEFRGDQVGHPSNLAGVRFRCEPSEELSFVSTPCWPDALSANYIALLENAILSGVLDVLIAEDFTSYSGCSLTLTDIRWDDVSSSELAFYIASKGAARKLIAEGGWE